MQKKNAGLSERLNQISRTLDISPSAFHVVASPESIEATVEGFSRSEEGIELIGAFLRIRSSELRRRLIQVMHEMATR